MKPLISIASFMAILVLSLPICLSAEINLIYDANGNLLSDGTHNRTYNGLNQLIQVTDATTGNLIQTFVHDPIEERIIKKVEYHLNQSIKETVYYFEKDYIRIVNSSGTFDKEIINLAGHQIAEYDHTSQTTEYKFTDHLGSITQTISDNAFNPSSIANGSLIFKDSSGTITAVFESNGNIWTKGGIIQNTNPTRTANDEWIYRANDQDQVILDMDTGGLYLAASLIQTSSITQDTNQDEFILKDSAGSIVLLINESGHILYTGDILTGSVQNIEYEPYGALTSEDSSIFAYEGKELSDSGYDFHFRNYNPELGLFTQPDTLLPNVYDPQQLNRYAFERGNPYKYVDEEGHIFGLKRMIEKAEEFSRNTINLLQEMFQSFLDQIPGGQTTRNIVKSNGGEVIRDAIKYGYYQSGNQIFGDKYFSDEKVLDSLLDLTASLSSYTLDKELTTATGGIYGVVNFGYGASTGGSIGVDYINKFINSNLNIIFKHETDTGVYYSDNPFWVPEGELPQLDPNDPSFQRNYGGSLGSIGGGTAHGGTYGCSGTGCT